ncbi:hypothetical protein MNQ98_20810 [Paenibacillus sp. N3/727]|uniref:hypothetical protein n=1 Tax=Paenibacillus sp. N3/727 TaxID=2925845 RepID=UPI001F537E10|nr:hypothetical protein [Paenibacillus sp. N3/727]UNK16916.1 hypothetical protein MNQ98_20810 [Paenibacillus sp. N3/727]
MNSVVFKEVNIKGTICYRNVFPAVIDMIASGALQSEKLITSKIKVDDITEKGFEALLKNKNEIKYWLARKRKPVYFKPKSACLHKAELFGFFVYLPI